MEPSVEKPGKPRGIRIGCLVAAVGAVVVLGAAILLFVHGMSYLGTYDSDVKPVSRSVIDDRLKMWLGMTLPTSAKDVHVLIQGGLNPRMFLRFTATPVEADRFEGQILMRRGALARIRPPAWMDEVAGRTWWQAARDAPWRGSSDFLAVDNDAATGTVYLAVYLK
jgi:hypothetical protein